MTDSKSQNPLILCRYLRYSRGEAPKCFFNSVEKFSASRHPILSISALIDNSGSRRGGSTAALIRHSVSSRQGVQADQVGRRPPVELRHLQYGMFFVRFLQPFPPCRLIRRITMTDSRANKPAILAGYRMRLKFQTVSLLMAERNFEGLIPSLRRMKRVKVGRSRKPH